MAAAFGGEHGHVRWLRASRDRRCAGVRARWLRSQWGVPVSSLAQANAGLRSYDQQPFRTSAKSSMQEATYEAWRHRPKRFYAGTAPASLDWDVDGLKESKISAPRPGMAVVPGSGADTGAIDVALGSDGAEIQGTD